MLAIDIVPLETLSKYDLKPFFALSQNVGIGDSIVAAVTASKAGTKSPVAVTNSLVAASVFRNPDNSII